MFTYPANKQECLTAANSQCRVECRRCDNQRACEVIEKLFHAHPGATSTQFDDAECPDPEKDTDICLNCECFQIILDEIGLCQNERSHHYQDVIGMDHPTCEYVQWKRSKRDEASASREDGCTCQKCGRKYKVDLLVSDDMWDRINPEKTEGYREYELLCGSCIMGLIESRSSFSAFRLDDMVVDESHLKFDEVDRPDPEKEIV